MLSKNSFAKVLFGAKLSENFSSKEERRKVLLSHRLRNKLFFCNKKRVFTRHIFMGRSYVFLQRIFPTERYLPAASAAALLPYQSKVPGGKDIYAALQRAFFVECRVPRRKDMLFVNFLFLRADLGKRIFAPRCAGRRTWGNP